MLISGSVAYAYTQGIGPFRQENDSDSQEDNDREINSDNYDRDEAIPNSDSENTTNENEQDSGQTTSNKPAVSKEQVEVAITNAYREEGTVEVRAFVPGVIESGGTCKAVLTLGNEKVTSTSKGASDAQTTQCQTIIIPVSEFKQKGQWNAIVEYSSSKYQGKSGTIKVDI